MIPRLQIDFAKARMFKGKAFIIYGPRQAGKTTFSEMLLREMGKKTLRLNGDDADTRELLAHPNASTLKALAGDNEVLFIDEAQRIPGIGLTIKIITDQVKGIQVIATGSSSFELAGHVNEPLTGRKYEMMLLPPAWQELANYTDFLTERRLLEHRLIFGSYPEIVMDQQNATEHLKLIANSYLYKDLFVLEQIKKPQLLEKIVKALALQVGSEVNVNELSQLVGADNKTVEKYISLLEQAFVVFTLHAFSGNVRNEIRKSRKLYFHDNGIINAVTGNFAPLRQRTDVGALWENYLMSERKKWLCISQSSASMHFWRTTQQQEIDYVEQDAEKLLAAEFKWNPKSKRRFPVTFTKAYSKAKCLVFSTENYHEFLAIA